MIKADGWKYAGAQVRTQHYVSLKFEVCSGNGSRVTRDTNFFRTDGQTDGRTEGRKDGRMDGQRQIYMPPPTLSGGGIKTSNKKVIAKKPLTNLCEMNSSFVLLPLD